MLSVPAETVSSSSPASPRISSRSLVGLELVIYASPPLPESSIRTTRAVTVCEVVCSNSMVCSESMLAPRSTMESASRPPSYLTVSVLALLASPESFRFRTSRWRSVPVRSRTVIVSEPFPAATARYSMPPKASVPALVATRTRPPLPPSVIVSSSGSDPPLTVSMSVSPGAPPTSTRASAAALTSQKNWSLPSPPLRRSTPAPPSRTSLPAPPSKVSAPASPNNRSSPAPPSRLSSPASPKSWSSPASPYSESFPRPPQRMSFPSPPYNRSVPGP